MCVCERQRERETSSQTSTMKHYLLLLLAGLCACAPVEQNGMQAGSCQDAQAVGAAGLALTKINEDREEGYILSLHRLANVNVMPHGETGMVFYLTLDVVETNCHVLSRKDWKTCEARPTHDTPVYGQCKAAIYINRIHRVVRLYKYNCVIRPAPAEKVAEVCPDCPSHIAMDDAEILKTASLSLEKFNKENGLPNHFALLNITRATSQMGIAVFYNVEYTVQETSCAKSTDAAQADKCPLMECEFAHKGHCKSSHSHSQGQEDITVECDIFEPEAAEREKRLHLLGGETDHSHTVASGDNHDHAHDHTKSHQRHDQTHTHTENCEHHHTHDHGHEHGPTHAHDHSHDHGHGHDHVHAHHAKAHDHSGDVPNQHHSYQHGASVNTHHHDHELALDHDHKHAHLHEHEHHHHHQEHEHESHHHHHPEGMVRVLPALGQPVTLPSFPDQPVAGPEVGVTLPLIPDPQVPGEREPTILPFPASISPECPAPVSEEVANSLVGKLFAEDAMFKAVA